MADPGQPHGDLPSASRILALHSEQEAIDLDLGPSQPQLFPQLSTSSTNQSPSKTFRWWRRHVSMGVPHDACRDHLANERTFLGYLRTGQTFAMLGVVIAQLMRLHHSPSPDSVIGFFVVSVPLSCVCHACAIGISAIGAIRFFRHQKEMARGFALAGGWEIKTVGMLATLILLSILLLTAIIPAEQE